MKIPVLVRRGSGIILVTLFIMSAACGQPGEGDSTPLTETLSVAAAGLGELTVQIHENMLLRNNMDEFEAVASEDYVVMIPGGRRETREEAIAGAVNFDVEAVSFSNVATRVHGSSAVVTGTWSVSGRLRGIDMSGEYEFMAVYERSGERWTLVAESVTRKRDSLEEALGG